MSTVHEHRSAYFRPIKKGIKEFGLSCEDAQKKDDWVLKIKAVISYNLENGG